MRPMTVFDLVSINTNLTIINGTMVYCSRIHLLWNWTSIMFCAYNYSPSRGNSSGVLIKCICWTWLHNKCMKLSVISFIYFGNEFPQFYFMEIMRKCSSYMPSIYKKWKKHIKIYSKFVNPQSIKYNRSKINYWK